ncbi:MAG: hypothetical protein M3Q85_06280 [Acidobacteriota bacterium]|nr:hypothetical protein [Acidobacteriota bacterium]
MIIIGAFDSALRGTRDPSPGRFGLTDAADLFKGFTHRLAVEGGIR